MAILFLWFIACVILVGVGVTMGPIMADKANKKEKKRKLALMRAYPHLAREIWQSIEGQDAHHRAKMDAYHNGIGTAFEKAGASVQKAQMANSRRARAIVRMGFGVAKKFAK
jgi:hypothetical protein